MAICLVRKEAAGCMEIDKGVGYIVLNIPKRERDKIPGTYSTKKGHITIEEIALGYMKRAPLSQETDGTQSDRTPGNCYGYVKLDLSSSELARKGHNRITVCFSSNGIGSRYDGHGLPKIWVNLGHEIEYNGNRQPAERHSNRPTFKRY